MTDGKTLYDLIWDNWETTGSNVFIVVCALAFGYCVLRYAVRKRGISFLNILSVPLLLAGVAFTFASQLLIYFMFFGIEAIVFYFIFSRTPGKYYGTTAFLASVATGALSILFMRAVIGGFIFLVMPVFLLGCVPPAFWAVIFWFIRFWRNNAAEEDDTAGLQNKYLLWSCLLIPYAFATFWYTGNKPAYPVNPYTTTSGIIFTAASFAFLLTALKYRNKLYTGVLCILMAVQIIALHKLYITVTAVIILLSVFSVCLIRKPLDKRLFPRNAVLTAVFILIFFHGSVFFQTVFLQDFNHKLSLSGSRPRYLTEILLWTEETGTFPTSQQLEDMHLPPVNEEWSYNRALGGLSVEQVPANTAMFVDHLSTPVITTDAVKERLHTEYVVEIYTVSGKRKAIFDDDAETLDTYFPEL